MIPQPGRQAPCSLSVSPAKSPGGRWTAQLLLLLALESRFCLLAGLIWFLLVLLALHAAQAKAKGTRQRGPNPCRGRRGTSTPVKERRERSRGGIDKVVESRKKRQKEEERRQRTNVSMRSTNTTTFTSSTSAENFIPSPLAEVS